jgi:hypothetical protein
MESQDDYDTRKERRQYLFDILSSASAYCDSSEEGTVLSKTGLKEYRLCEGGEVIDAPYTTTRNIGDWLRDENRSTFLFPANIAHPDLMFILERKGEDSEDGDGPRTDRIICALQVKYHTTMKYLSLPLIPSLVETRKYRQFP